MTSREYQTVREFETKLTIGQQVRINWTNGGGFYSSRGKVCKINSNSVKVAIADFVPPGYTRNTVIKAPLLTTGSSLKLWSVNNRVEPLHGYRT